MLGDKPHGSDAAAAAVGGELSTNSGSERHIATLTRLILQLSRNVPDSNVWKERSIDYLKRNGLLSGVFRGATAPEKLLGEEGVTVWFGAMPESNGKSNWTALLLRKEGSPIEAMADAVTLERSEYKDRVRYVADRARWVLGEISERPDVLDYDPDLVEPPELDASAKSD
ncbi:hypothetical protein [Bosea sp. RAC05]|uniref:hypothetical protein n=1 Tax=Bosea sp. RAC05 TaxID=1842539 RepID=UPI00083E4B45|nr:hypothetical protein [Bosea sp. RAC05]AOG03406.1 hypothetical protein BSY19_5147 [Bosea sp. RAC05]